MAGRLIIRESYDLPIPAPDGGPASVLELRKGMYVALEPKHAAAVLAAGKAVPEDDVIAGLVNPDTLDYYPVPDPQPAPVAPPAPPEE